MSSLPFVVRCPQCGINRQLKHKPRPGAVCRHCMGSRTVTATAHREKTECVNGHPFTTENTYIRITPSGTKLRTCRTCRAARGRVVTARVTDAA